MPKYTLFIIVIVIVVTRIGAQAQPQSGDVARGAGVFENCVACHSLAPAHNMTGPSLAGIWGRKAGSLKSFDRYSSALKASTVVWDDRTLDAWLESPQRFIPGTRMTFAGMSDARQRADVIAFLKNASHGKMPAAGVSRGDGMAMAPQFHDLHRVAPDRQVRSMRICRDSYFVTTGDGKTTPFWEPNLRFKTDSSDLGPADGVPVIMPTGMMGDRAAVIFAKPEEISGFIKHRC